MQSFSKIKSSRKFRNLQYLKHFILGDNWQITASEVDEKGEPLKTLDEKEIYQARFVAIASGHHAKPSYAEFAGQKSFTGMWIWSLATTIEVCGDSLASSSPFPLTN